MKKWTMAYRIMILTLLAATLLSACYYDNEQDLYPNGCNTVDITYADHVLPLLERSCITCHNKLSQNGNVNLEGYDSVKRQVDNGKLIGAIRHEPGFSAMPQGGPMLSSCSVDRVQAWIDSGAPDN